MLASELDATISISESQSHSLHLNLNLNQLTMKVIQHLLTWNLRLWSNKNSLSFSFVCPSPPDIADDSQFMSKRSTFTLHETTAVSFLIPPKSDLCFLYKTIESSPYIPVARSYDGQPWERSGGHGGGALEWICDLNESESSADSIACTNKLPAGNYVLETRRAGKAQTQSWPETWAQFLESASFGITSQMASEVLQKREEHPTNVDEVLANHVYEQIHVQPMTSHREYFRRRLNPVDHYHHPAFAVRANPCVALSTWSRQFLSMEDWNRIIQVRESSSAGLKEVMVDGEVRSIVLELRFIKTRSFNASYIDAIEGDYSFCGNIASLQRGIVFLRQIKTGKSPCRILINTQVEFPALEPPVQRNNVSNSDTAVEKILTKAPFLQIEGSVESITDETAWKALPTYFYNKPEYVRQRRIQSPSCSSSDNEPVSVPTLFTERTNSSVPNKIPTIFACTEDGTWLIHRPTLFVAQNSLEQPEPSGGHSLLTKKVTKHCANVGRNFLNEESCILSSPNNGACHAYQGDAEAGGERILLCGSPGEVASDPQIGGNSWLGLASIVADQLEGNGIPRDVLPQSILRRQREDVWQDIAVGAPDQMRQRMAWALSQIFSLSKTSIRRERFLTESFTSYYDIFVRNAFGNYRDVLKETTYHPLMAESLSFVKSQSVGKSFAQAGVLSYPDENFAREVMQLFTIGLVQLRPDGTPLLDLETNQSIPTYTADDVANFARVWTGFAYQPKRGNIENSLLKINQVDPVRIVADRRDRFPKANLKNGHLGDGYPLCTDFPNRPFLLVGAKYQALGSLPLPELVPETKGLALSETAQRLSLQPSTPLFETLCHRQSEDASCSYPSIVVLDTNIPCLNDTVDRPECQVDQIRVVKVEDVYYEYVRPACVEQTFFNNGIQVRNADDALTTICANPALPVASEACCPLPHIDGDGVGGNLVAFPECQFSGERMVFHTALERCAGVNRTLCQFSALELNQDCRHRLYHWTKASCEVSVKINSQGDVALVHGLEHPEPTVNASSPSYFRVYWDDRKFPSAIDCSVAGCALHGFECICSISVSETSVVSEKPNAFSEVKGLLHIGFPKPEMFSSDLFQVEEFADYKIYTPRGEECCGKNTIFEAVVNGAPKFFRNVRSIVSIPGTKYNFRNPPSFNSAIPSEYSRDTAIYETESAFDDLFFHSNTAPFVAFRMIQRFGISNPSPVYLKAVANAFTSGRVVFSGIVFGTGKYGDLSSTIAEVLLNREARSASLKGDPSHGSLREPILKVLSLIRALGFQSTTPLLDLAKMTDKIGQSPYGQPSVFGFFQPEYSPPGRASLSLLRAPEVQPVTAGKVLGLVNGFFSLLRNGLVQCEHGFASYGCTDFDQAYSNISSGQIDIPSSTSLDVILENLFFALTAGRLGKPKQLLIRSAVSGLSDFRTLQQATAQYIITTPEFHTTSSVNAKIKTERKKGKIPSAGRPSTPYKAVIHVSLTGGCDSYSVLVPDPSCTLYTNYQTERGILTLEPNQMLTIQGNNAHQPCQRFGVNSELSQLHSLYEDNDLVFFANTGVLTEPVNKTDYRHKTKAQLFAHNTMKMEVNSLDPFDAVADSGALGRIAQKLQRQGYKIGLTAVDSSIDNLNGGAAVTSATPLYNLDGGDISRLEVNISNPVANDVIRQLNGFEIGGDQDELGGQAGVYGEVWSDLLLNSINQSDTLYALLQSTTQTKTTFAETVTSQRAQLIAKLIQKREERNVDRDFFVFSMSGYDTHSDSTELPGLFSELNESIGNLVAELKALGVWENVVIVQTSEFGRTLTPNSGGGSDHGWGGNYWMAGGSVRGGQIKGQYIDSFSVTGSRILGRGRAIPTTSFDSYFHGIAEWTGLESDEDLDFALPNRGKFPDLCSAKELFRG